MPEDKIDRDLQQSIADEHKAIADYTEREERALAAVPPDVETAKVYAHIIPEEGQHAEEFTGRAVERETEMKDPCKKMLMFSKVRPLTRLTATPVTPSEEDLKIAKEWLKRPEAETEAEEGEGPTFVMFAIEKKGHPLTLDEYQGIEAAHRQVLRKAFAAAARSCAMSVEEEGE